MEKVRYMISDAAALAGVETHVLRYWEEELDLTIPRNEMGHRYYTRENIQEFQKIKELKEKGYQLKAIRMILHNKNPEDAGVSVPDSAAPGPLPACNREHHHTVVAKPDRQNATAQTGKESAIAEYVFSEPLGKEFKKRLIDFLSFLLPLYDAEGRYRITIALGCTGGKHRSVAMTEALMRALKRQDYTVSVEHRHMELG